MAYMEDSEDLVLQPVRLVLVFVDGCSLSDWIYWIDDFMIYGCGTKNDNAITEDSDSWYTMEDIRCWGDPKDEPWVSS